MDKATDFVLTYSGLKFYPLDPKPEQVCIEDIAHALSMLNRFTCHSLIPFSVAQHAIEVMKIVRSQGYDPYWCLIALHHDSSEYIANDISTPIKKQLPEYKQIEERIQDVIYQAFGLPIPDKDDYKKIIKNADNIMVINEMKKLMRHPDLFDYPEAENFIEVDVFQYKMPMQVKAEFLYWHHLLMNEYKQSKE